MKKGYKQKIVMSGLLMRDKKEEKDIHNGFKEMGFHKPIIVGQFQTLAGQGGSGGRNEVVALVHETDIPKLAVSFFHLSGGFSWVEDYINNNKEIIPVEGYKLIQGE